MLGVDFVPWQSRVRCELLVRRTFCHAVIENPPPPAHPSAIIGDAFVSCHWKLAPQRWSPADSKRLLATLPKGSGINSVWVALSSSLYLNHVEMPPVFFPSEWQLLIHKLEINANWIVILSSKRITLPSSTQQLLPIIIWLVFNIWKY